MKTLDFRQSITFLAGVIVLSGRLSAAFNGGFESDFSAWLAVGNVSIQSAAPYHPTEGGKLAAFNAANSTPGGFLETAVEVIPGRHYRFEFDVGNLSYNSLHQKLQVKAEDNVSIPPPPGARAPYVVDVIDIAGPGGGATKWVAASYDFTPFFSSLRLTFTDFSQATNSLDLVLDHIRITEIPESSPILNGGFESGLAGWTATGNVSTQAAPPYLATEGSRLAAFNAANSAPSGTLSQDIPAVAGQLYRLEFDVGNLSYNSLHQRLKVQVQFQNFGHYYSMAEDIIDIQGPGGGATAWLSPSYDFISTNNVITLRFMDVSTATNSLDLVLDHIRLTPIAPTATHIVNGSFESGFDGWAISSVTGELSIKSSSPYAPTDGTKLAAFNSFNTPNFSSISQTVKTVPGQVYVLSFDAGNLAYNAQEQLIRVLVDANGNYRLANLAIAIPSNSFTGGTNWFRDQRIQFTAISDSTTFVFLDGSGVTNGVDLVLDRVRLVP